MKQVSPKELNILRIVAVVADTLQFGLIPSYFIVIGWFINAFLDIILFALFTWRLGFHVAFLPSFIAEFIPFVDLVPAWTLAVFFVTRNANSAAPVSVQIQPPTQPGASPQGTPPIKDIKAVDTPNPG